MANAPKRVPGIMAITPAELAKCVMASYELRRPLMIWGPPGTGKSEVVRDTAADHGLEFIDLRLVQLDSVDLRGMPYRYEDKGDDGTSTTVMGWAIPGPGLLPRRGRGILFLDELPQAPTLVLNSASELLLDRRIGEYRLPEGWSIICAGNRRTDRAGTMEVPTHLKNRLMHVEMKQSLDGWLDWAADHGVNAHVMAFLKSAPKHLYAFDADSMAWPSLRTWKFASDVINAGHKGKVLEALLFGSVGEKVGTELCAFLDRSLDLPSYADVIADPLGVPLPSKAGMVFSLTGMVAASAKIKDIDQVLKFFERFIREDDMGAENVHFGLIQMAEREKGFSANPAFADLLKRLEGKDKGQKA